MLMDAKHDGPSTPTRIDLVIGTRPNIVKAAPLLKALTQADWCKAQLVYLMQHTDASLADEPMEDLGIPAEHPVRLRLSTSGYGNRLGEMMASYSDHLLRTKPDLVVVFGDVDTTLAAAYAAKRQHIRLAHVEAGLRSGDRSMPEELNRLMVDAISDIHFTTTEQAHRQLLAEGHPRENVHHVGNLMIDSLLETVDREHGRLVCRRLGLNPASFGLATFHRPSNVDTREALLAIVAMLRAASQHIPLVLPLHPRTRSSLQRFGFEEELASIPGLLITNALRYRDFVSLLSLAKVVMTDSGGMQEECSVLGVHCLTVRENTERPETLHLGSNQLVAPRAAPDVLNNVLSDPAPNSANIPLWDGATGKRISAILQQYLRQD